MRILALHSAIKHPLVTHKILHIQTKNIYQKGIDATILENNRSFFITNLARGLLPGCLIVDTPLLNALKDCSPIQFLLTLTDQNSNHASISAQKARTFDLSLEHFPNLDTFERSNWSLLKNSLCQHKGGLDSWDNLFNTEHIIFKTLNAFSPFNEEEFTSGLRWLLGRGQGSTPAGDDMILGALGFWTLLALKNPLGQHHAKERILGLTKLQNHFDKLTTQMSVSYLNYGLERQFSSDYWRLLKSLFIQKNDNAIKNALHSMSHHGASSGIDTTAGLYLAGA